MAEETIFVRKDRRYRFLQQPLSGRSRCLHAGLGAGKGPGRETRLDWSASADGAGRRTAAVFGPNWCSEAYLIPKTHFGRVRCSPNLGDVLI
jgi:hypothetical protein